MSELVSVWVSEWAQTEPKDLLIHDQKRPETNERMKKNEEVNYLLLLGPRIGFDTVYVPVGVRENLKRTHRGVVRW